MKKNIQVKKKKEPFTYFYSIIYSRITALANQVSTHLAPAVRRTEVRRKEAPKPRALQKRELNVCVSDIMKLWRKATRLKISANATCCSCAECLISTNTSLRPETFQLSVDHSTQAKNEVKEDILRSSTYFTLIGIDCLISTTCKK